MTNYSKIRFNATFEQRSKRVLAAFNEFVEIEKMITDNYSIGSKEGRVILLDNIKAATRSLVVYLHQFSLMNKDRVYGMKFWGLSSPQNVPPFSRNNLKFIKLSWITTVQFQLETFIKISLKSLGLKVEHSYTKNINKLCSALFGARNETEIRDALSAFAKIRNTQHANGIYHHKKVEYKIDGVSYVFNNNSGISCGTIDHLIHLWSKSFKLIECTCEKLSQKGIYEFPSQYFLD